MEETQLTAAEAAEIIGCSTSHVRYLIRTERLEATAVENPAQRGGKLYRISREEAERFRDTPSSETRGWPRGKARKARKERS